MARATAKSPAGALARGEPEAFAALYDRLGRSMFRVAKMMSRSSTEAEDAVQDVFVDLVRRRDRLEQVRDLDAYVFAMLRHAVMRRMKRQRTEERHVQQLIPPSVASSAECHGDDLENALSELPAEQREAITLKIDGGLTFAQIGEILNVSSNTAASRYRYGLEKLRRILE
jgi:RNA polymerase sigma-70 factor (ECF subfamily)